MRATTKQFAAIFVTAIIVGLFARVGISEDKPAAPQGDMATHMAEWMKNNTPGPQQAALKRMAGTYNADVTMKMSADAPEMKSKGQETNRMILNDRFLQSEYTGDMMGSPFNGMNLVGYDNMKKKYVSVWLDSMSTGMMINEGTADESGKTITYKGECLCPMDGKMKPFKQIVNIVDDNHFEVEMFTQGPDDKEYRSMKIVYSRAQ